MNCIFLIIYLILTFLIGVHETLPTTELPIAFLRLGYTFLLILPFIFSISLHQNEHLLTSMLLSLMEDNYDHWTVNKTVF